MLCELFDVIMSVMLCYVMLCWLCYVSDHMKIVMWSDVTSYLSDVSLKVTHTKKILAEWVMRIYVFVVYIYICDLYMCVCVNTAELLYESCGLYWGQPTCTLCFFFYSIFHSCLIKKRHHHHHYHGKNKTSPSFVSFSSQNFLPKFPSKIWWHGFEYHHLHTHVLNPGFLPKIRCPPGEKTDTAEARAQHLGSVWRSSSGRLLFVGLRWSVRGPRTGWKMGWKWIFYWWNLWWNLWVI